MSNIELMILIMAVLAALGIFLVFCVSVITRKYQNNQLNQVKFESHFSTLLCKLLSVNEAQFEILSKSLEPIPKPHTQAAIKAATGLLVSVRDNDAVRIAQTLSSLGIMETIATDMQSGSGRQRMAALQLLGHLRGFDILKLLLAAIPKDKRQNWSDHQYIALLSAIGKQGHMLEQAWLTEIKDNAKLNTLLLADMLSQFDHRSIPILVELLHKPMATPMVCAALLSLRSLQTIEALPTMLCYAQRTHPLLQSGNESNVRYIALSCLGKVLMPLQWTLLLDFLNDPDDKIRQLAMQTIANLKVPAALAYMINAMQDECWDVRRTATQGVGNMGEGGVKILKMLSANTNMIGDMAQKWCGSRI